MSLIYRQLPQHFNHIMKEQILFGSENLFIVSGTNSDVSTHSFRNSLGPIDYGFTNDYLFNTIMQHNQSD